MAKTTDPTEQTNSTPPNGDAVTGADGAQGGAPPPVPPTPPDSAPPAPPAPPKDETKPKGPAAKTRAQPETQRITLTRGTTSVIYQGDTYLADEAGEVEVPAEVAAYLSARQAVDADRQAEREARIAANQLTVTDGDDEDDVRPRSRRR